MVADFDRLEFAGAAPTNLVGSRMVGSVMVASHESRISTCLRSGVAPARRRVRTNGHGLSPSSGHQHYRSGSSFPS